MTKHDDSAAARPAPRSVKELAEYDVEWIKRHLADPKDGEAKERAGATLEHFGPLGVDGVLYEFDAKEGVVRSGQKRTDQSAVDDDDKAKTSTKTKGRSHAE